MPGIDDFLKMLDEQDYSRALRKEKTKKAVKDTVSPPKSPEQLLSEQIQEETIKKKAKSIVNPVSKEEIETKALERQIKLKKAKEEAEPETGTEATDRLLEAIKTARGKVISGDKPIYSQDFPKDKGYEEWMTTGMRVNPTKTGYREYLGTPKPNTVSEIGLGRVKELKDELQTAKYAKDKDIPFEEAQQSAPVRKAYKSKIDELVKMFNQPGVDPRKVRYLIKLQSQEWLKRNYPAYSNR